MPETAPPETLIEPADEFNRKLVENVHPPGWVNPEPRGVTTWWRSAPARRAGLGGRGGRAGARSAIVERHLMGGDCLNIGCVPSKG